MSVVPTSHDSVEISADSSSVQEGVSQNCILKI